MGQILKIEYDMEDMVLGIKEAVKEELKPEIAEEIREEIKSEIKSEIMNKVKEQIPEDTSVWLKDIMKEIYDTEIIRVGGGWNEDDKEYTLREYVIEQIKDRIVNNDCGSKKSYSSTSFNEWFRDKCVDTDSMFDSSTKQMLSEAVLNVLMANDTYKKIESNIGSIASK